MVVINIDTNKDSKEDIRKSIEFLQKFLHRESFDREPAGPEPEVNPSTFNLFKNTELPESKPEPKKSEDIDIKPIFY